MIDKFFSRNHPSPKNPISRFLAVILPLLSAVPCAGVTISPNPISVTVNSGETASLPLTLSNPASSAVNWRLELQDQSGVANTLESLRTSITASGTTINGPIPLRTDFTEGETGTSIASGDSGSFVPIFNQGNRLTTNLGGPLNYSNGGVATSTSLGTGGRYFTRKLPGLFIFAADLNSVSWFEVAGSITYGQTRQTSEFTITRDGKTWSAFIAKTADHWRTINHLILVDQAGLSQSTGTAATDQRHRISGLSGRCRLYHLLFITSTSTMQPDSVFLDLANRFLDAGPRTIPNVVSVTPASGSVTAAGTTAVTMNANAIGVSPGTSTGHLVATSSTGTLLSTTPVTFVVNAPRLEVPAIINYVSVKTMDPTTVSAAIHSGSSTPETWTASIPNAPSWLSLVTASGTTPTPLELRFTPGTLAAGTYRSNVRIVSGAATFEIPVVFRIDDLAIGKFLADPARPLLYALNQNAKQQGALLVIDAIRQKITRAIAVGKEPTDLDLSEDGSQIIVINTTEPSLSRVSLSTFSVIETIPLADFSNGNEDIGGHVKCGKGNIVYYVDEQWGPRLRVFNSATRTVLQTFSSESATTPDTSNNYGFGDIALSPDRTKLFGWRQYGDGAGVVGTHLVRFSINADGTLGSFARSSDYSSSNFTREPFNTPILFTRDGSRLVVKDRVVNQADLNNFPIVYPDEIYSITSGGEIAVGANAIYAGQGGEVLHTLPLAAPVQAVLPDYSALAYFNSTTKLISWLDLVSTLGTSTLGLNIQPANGATVTRPRTLKWLPVTGIRSYQIYLGTNRSLVESATTSSSLFLGLVTGNEMALTTDLLVGQSYFWRAVPVDASGNPVGSGTLHSFNVSNLTLSRSSIAAETVQGVTTHLETIQLDSSTPQAWTATESTAWIKSVTTSGTAPGSLQVEIDASGLSAGLYQGSVTITSSGSSLNLPVSLRVYAANFTHAQADQELPYVLVISQGVDSSTQPAFVLRLNTETNKIETAIPCGTNVTSMAIHYFENRIYLTNWSTGILRAFDRTSLAQVQTYQFSPSAPTGYGNGDAYVVAAGRSGRIMVEEQDQWIDSWLVDTVTGNKLAAFSSREGGGLFEPTGRYYYHGENNSSGAKLNKYDTTGDKITSLATKRVESFSYYGSRLVTMSGDGSRVFWNGGVFDQNLNVLMQLNEEIISSTYRGELLFTNTKAVNGANSQTLATLPLDTKVQAVSGDQKKLFLFKNAAVSVVDLATIANVSPRGLIPGIANGSTVIGTVQELTWSQEAAAISYDVYFGSSAAAVSAATKTSPEYLGNVTGTKWDGSLQSFAPGGNYFWRIDLNGFSSVTKGSTWSFGIASVDVMPRSVEIAAPAGSPLPRQSLALTAEAATSWTASTTTPWITLRTTSGSTPSSLQFDINTTGLTVGAKMGSITLQAAGKSFSVPVELTIVTLNVTKLITHPNRPVVYAISTSLAGEGFSHLLEINPATAGILRTLPIGFAPTDADLDPVSERLYISNWGYSDTRVIDVAAWTELPSLKLGEDVFKLEITPKGRLITEEQDQWIQLNIWDSASGTNLGNSSNPYFSVREGDGQVDPTGNFYYHCDNNSSGATIQKYNIAEDKFTLAVTGPQIGYGSRNLILSEDGKRLFWLGRALDENLNLVATMPSNAEVHATNRTGEIAIGQSAIWWSDSGTQLSTLPFASTVATVSANDAFLIRFNATSRTLHSTAIPSITDLPGPWPRPGQILSESPQRFSWTPVDGATSYRVYIAADAAVLQAMTAPTATVASAFYDPPAALNFGRFYSWRVDAVRTSGVVTGNVQSFSIRFPQGPQLAMSTNQTGAAHISLSQGKLLLGSGSQAGSWNSWAQLFDINFTTGATDTVQRLSQQGNSPDDTFGSSVGMDQNKLFVGVSFRNNPATAGGNVFAYRLGTYGLWEQSNILAPPSPVASEYFGRGLATAGNLMLAGTSSNQIGRVVAYITEPDVVQTQVFSASDGAVRDGFGSVIVMDGNRAIISATGSGASSNRIPNLYAFTRSTDTGLWTQSQRITIPNATTFSQAGRALALSGSTMAVRVSGSAVAIFTLNNSNQWVHSVTLNSSAVTGSSSNFGISIALHGDQLFIGDTGATHQGTSGGVVYSYRRNGTSWIPGPVITPAASRSGFGRGMACREGWLVVTGDTENRPASVYKIDQAANRIPWFTKNLPSQLVAGRAFSIPVEAMDADGNAGLTITKLQGPSWLNLTDSGLGAGQLSGTPAGASGSTHDAQFEVSDAQGARTFYAMRITLLSPTDLPIMTQEPTGATLGVGQEFVLRASVSGIGPFQWQWYRDGNLIPGATRDSLVLGDVNFSDAGRYQARVSNVVGEVSSSEVVLTVNPANRYAGDWTTFGSSPSHTGRHPAALNLTYFRPAWNATVQSGFALNRAAIANGRAVIVPQSRFATGISVRALDLQTGASQWSFPVPSSNSTNPPSIHQDRVYFQRGKGFSDVPQLFCLNATNGSQVWVSTFGAQWESYEAPAVTDQGIFVNGGTYGGMYGFNHDGSERFFHSLAQYDRWTPTIANGRLFSWVAGGFTEHNPNDGSPLWSINSGSSTSTVSAVSGNSAALISTTDLICVDLPSRSIRWRVNSAHRGSPAIADGRVFAIQGNAVRSYSLSDGSASVVYQTTDAASTTLVDQPILFNDRLVVSSEQKTWVFQLDGKLLQTLNAGGRLSYSNSYLLAAGQDGTLRAFRAVHDNANLASLSLSVAEISPQFDKDVTEYITTVPFGTTSTTVAPVLEQADASLTVNGAANAPVALVVGNNTISVRVLAEDGVTEKTYRVVVTRLPQEFVFHSSADVPVSSNGFVAGSYPVVIRLAYAPQPGTTLTMVNNTSLQWIIGSFSNVIHGQKITLSHDGDRYDFVVNYFGGTGNDLVLQWADTSLAAWGYNSFGQLGDGTMERRLAPVSVNTGTALEGKTITAISSGYLHSIALTSDGSVFSWGANSFGQLGNGSSSNVSTPTEVPKTGALSGKIVVDIAAGAFHNVALCSDGTIVSWGYNNHGQLGDGTRVNRNNPITVSPVGALIGKQVVSIAAGANHSFALCSDGTVAAWGYNDEGELGNGDTVSSLTPVLVKPDGVLAGRKIGSLAAGQYHTIALCTDGGLVAWGYNNRGQVGNSSTTNAIAPVQISTQGALAGKVVKSITTGSSHSSALCADGSIVVWGHNHRSQLGLSDITSSTTPILSGVSGANATSIKSGGTHTLMCYMDGSLSTWGDNTHGQLGNNTMVHNINLSPLDFSSLSNGNAPTTMFTGGGSSAMHSLAVVAMPRSTLSARAIVIPSITGIPTEPHADPDNDGMTNLVEYAFGLDPLANSQGQLPQARLSNGELFVDFETPIGVSGVIYGAEWSETLHNGSWLPIADSGENGKHRFAIPTTTQKAFIRLTVTIPSSNR